MSQPFNAGQAIKDSGLASGEYLKLKEGANKMRLMSPALFHSGIFEDKKTGEKRANNKFVAWVFDWADGKVKLFFMSKTVLEAIGALQDNPDYAFDTVPMPYDITVNAKDAGTKDVMYSLTPSRQNTPVPVEALNQMDGKETIEAVLSKLREKDGQVPAPVTPVQAVAPARDAFDEIAVEEMPPHPAAV